WPGGGAGARSIGRIGARRGAGGRSARGGWERPRVDVPVGPQTAGGGRVDEIALLPGSPRRADERQGLGRDAGRSGRAPGRAPRGRRRGRGGALPAAAGG